jgi:hypothetical protein
MRVQFSRCSLNKVMRNVLHAFEHVMYIQWVQCNCGLRFILFKFVKNINEPECIIYTHTCPDVHMPIPLV